MLQVILTGPHDLHGFGDRRCHLYRLGHHIRLLAPAESSTNERDMHTHTLSRHAARLRRGILRALWILRPRPDLAEIVLQAYGAVQWLHRGVSLIRGLVRSFYHHRRRT